jgi:hypothetical protein
MEWLRGYLGRWGSCFAFNTCMGGSSSSTCRILAHPMMHHKAAAPTSANLYHTDDTTTGSLSLSVTKHRYQQLKHLVLLLST